MPSKEFGSTGDLSNKYIHSEAFQGGLNLNCHRNEAPYQLLRTPIVDRYTGWPATEEEVFNFPT